MAVPWNACSLLPQTSSKDASHKYPVHECDVMEYVHDVKWQQFIAGTDFTRLVWITIGIMGVECQSSVKVDHENTHETCSVAIQMD